MKPLLLALALLVTASAAHAREEGNDGGHGGDPYALEFKTIGDELANKLAVEETRDPTLFVKWKFSAADIKKLASFVRVTSAESDQMILKGQEVDAINFPGDNLIKVNRARWRENDLAGRARIVLHEIFGIKGVERDSFDASIDFADFMTKAVTEISAETTPDSFMVSLFYGQCLSFPGIVETETCESGSDKLAKAEACARTQAEGKCRISGRSSCKLINTSYTAKLSTTQIGLRYCEVLVLMK